MTPSAERHPDLIWVLDVLWGQAPPDGGVASMRVIPSIERARMLVPDDRAAATVALRAAAGTRSRTAQRARSIAAALIRVGAFGDRVSVPSEDPLAAAIASACGVADVLIACAIRRPGPFRKPVLQILAPHRGVIAYAKVAWNEVTAMNVTAEHTALTSLHGAAVSAPTPIALVEHQGFPVLVTEPMPASLRRYDGDRPPPDPEIARQVARILGEPDGADPIGTRLRARLAATSPTTLSQVREATVELVEAIDASALEAGAWHGDWSPWNLGWVGDRLWAWDWEYCRAAVPVGLDAPHFEFQRRFIQSDVALDDAFREAADAAARPLAALGYADDDRAIVHAVHVAEVSLRYLEAAGRGVEANPRFVARAVPALRRAVAGVR